MPKDKESKTDFLLRMVNQYPGMLRTDKTVLLCIYCNCSITGNKIFHVKQHFETKKHKSIAERRKSNKNGESSQQLLQFSENKLNLFCMDLCKMFVGANIPINKINNPAFITFLEKYTNNTIPCQTTLRTKYVPVIYNKCIENLRIKARNKHIWISIDETTDREQRLIVNFIFGIMDGSEHEKDKSYLLNVDAVQAANANSIAAFLTDSLVLLWPEGIKYQNVLLVVTDAAAYMIAAMQSMRVLYPNMLHLTCLAHGLHRIAEFIRYQFPAVNELISKTKSVFAKAPSRRKLFKNEYPDLKLPPQPCITRWGTWLEAADYYCKNFNAVHSFLQKLDDQDSDAICETKKIFSNKDIQTDLAFIKTNFSCLIDGITKLQTRGLCLNESVSIIEFISAQLKSLGDDIYFKKLNAVLKRNPGYKTIAYICRILYKNEKLTDEYITKLSPHEITFFKHCITTSVDVERSFSVYTTVLNDQRRSFLLNNLKEHMIIHCNHNNIE